MMNMSIGQLDLAKPRNEGYNDGSHVLWNGAAFRGSRYMASEPRHLSIGFASGGLSSLLLQLLHEWSFRNPATLVPPEPELEFACQCTFQTLFNLSDREFLILVLGVSIGLLILPIIELLLVLKQAWSLWVRARFLGNNKNQLYRSV